MKKFQYQIVRYMHDTVTSEFVNVGVIVYNQETKFLKAKFLKKYSRVSQFFNNKNGNNLINSLRYFEKAIDETSNELKELFNNFDSLDVITSSILPKDDSALYYTDAKFAVDINFSNAIEDLYERYVNKYITEPETEIHDDKYVWKKVYKEYFDKFNITPKLKSHTFKTKNDNIEFDKAWKNGVWNCYETISFDLKSTDSIKNKVYKWSGILGALENSEQKLHLYFLTMLPKGKQELKSFIQSTIMNHNNQKALKVTMVDENQAEKFALNIKQEIEKHEASSDHPF